MASYTVATSEVGVYEKTLVANTVDTVTFQRNAGTIEVVSDGADEIYFTVDGSTPTVAGNSTYGLPAVASAKLVKVPPANRTGGSTVVKLISAGTPKYSITEG